MLLKDDMACTDDAYYVFHASTYIYIKTRLCPYIAKAKRGGDLCDDVMYLGQQGVYVMPRYVS